MGSNTQKITDWMAMAGAVSAFVFTLLSSGNSPFCALLCTLSCSALPYIPTLLCYVLLCSAVHPSPVYALNLLCFARNNVEGWKGQPSKNGTVEAPTKGTLMYLSEVAQLCPACVDQDMGAAGKNCVYIFYIILTIKKEINVYIKIYKILYFWSPLLL